LRLFASAFAGFRRYRSEQPVQPAGPDHAVQRHRQPGDVDPDRLLEDPDNELLLETERQL